MGQKYAGILGSLASTLVLARGLGSGAGLESTIATAISCLFGFAAVGWVAGRIAETLVEQSVRFRIQNAMKKEMENAGRAS